MTTVGCRARMKHKGRRKVVFHLASAVKVERDRTLVARQNEEGRKLVVLDGLRAGRMCETPWGVEMRQVHPPGMTIQGVRRGHARGVRGSHNPLSAAPPRSVCNWPDALRRAARRAEPSLRAPRLPRPGIFGSRGAAGGGGRSRSSVDVTRAELRRRRDVTPPALVAHGTGSKPSVRCHAVFAVTLSSLRILVVSSIGVNIRCDAFGAGVLAD